MQVYLSTRMVNGIVEAGFTNQSVAARDISLNPPLL
ncbi:hypothetical protein MiSe_52180 [Microseira wollei NIES-4236]|uniref:Uncharacterized protein n=1 Tax=Microseira wollei NIES-4236 TaxID=2530354 RepID=A0AAV3XIS0_9CYAN|nr:hypothetical protein MiSe_52180 [Microseira wollei NIES-4236]